MYGRDSVMGSQAEWSDLLEHSTDLVQSVGSDGRLLYVNQGWLKALGYERDEVSDLTVFEIIHPECSSQCAAMMKAVSEGEGIENVETTLVAKSGQQIRVEGSIDCRFKDGVPAATRCIFRDISERKAAEEALRQSELRLRTIMAAVQDGIVVLDAETHVVVEANDTAIEMYGGPREDIIGKSCYGAICPRREGECPITDEHRDLARSEAFLRKVSGEVVPVLKTAETVTLGGRGGVARERAAPADDHRRTGAARATARIATRVQPRDRQRQHHGGGAGDRHALRCRALRAFRRHRLRVRSGARCDRGPRDVGEKPHWMEQAGRAAAAG